MAKSPRRLSDYTPRDQFLPELHKLDEIKDTEVTLTAFEFREGDFGEYAVFTLIGEGWEEPMTFSCGGSAIVKQLHAIKFSDLPLDVRPVKVGRMWWFE